MCSAGTCPTRVSHRMANPRGLSSLYREGRRDETLTWLPMAFFFTDLLANTPVGSYTRYNCIGITTYYRERSTP